MSFYFFGSPRGAEHDIDFYWTQCVSLLEKYDRLSESVVFPKIGVLQTKMVQRNNMKMNFEYFRIQNWMLQTVRAENLHHKSGVICLVFMFSFWVMFFNLSKKVHFLQYCAGLGKKPKSDKAIYIYASESFHFTLSENDID